MRMLLLISLFIMPIAEAKKKQLDYASLETDYNNLVYNKKYKPFAKPEKQVAKKNVESLINKQVRRKNREQALYMAKHSIAYARLIAEQQWIQNEIDSENKVARDYELAISKTEAQISRQDAELARLMLIAQQEESQRAKERANQAEQITKNTLDQAKILKQETEAAKRYAEVQEEEANLAKQEAELAIQEVDSLRRKLNSIATEETDKGLMMTLGDFVFDSGKSTIKQEAVDNFSKVVEFINTYPNKQVQIEGHTDSSGSNQLNLKLSQRRADAVKKLLVENGISAKKIEALGMGEEFPIAENNSNAGKAKNRRVEIIILQ